MSDNKFNSEKAKFIDSERKKRLLRERQDRMLEDLQKQVSTPVIQDSSLSTDDIRHVKSKSAPIDTNQVEKLTRGSDFMDKIAKLKALKAAGKKVAGIIPFAGAGMAALQGDPAMAAEELAEDVAGPLAALKPEIAGNPQEERTMLAERQAIGNYKNSQAFKDKRGISEEDADINELSQPKRRNIFARLKGLIGD